MATLRDDLDSLLELQNLDSERDRTHRQIAGLDTGANAQAAADAARAKLDEQRSAASRNAGALKDAELELAGLEKKLKSYEDRMRSGQVTSPREVANVEREINQLVRQRAALDDRILTLMDEGERLRTALAEAEARSKQADQAHRSQVDVAHAQRAHLESIMTDLNRRRADAAEHVGDPALLKRYESIRARPASAGVAIARVEEGHCGGCHTQISSQDAHKAEDGSQLVLCENCGRILA